MASATFSASVFGNLAIDLSILTVSLAVPQLSEITALTLPSAFDVAAFMSKSPTVTVTSVISAFFNASFISVCTLSFVRSFVASIPATAILTTALASATFSASDFGSCAIVLLNTTLSVTLSHVITIFADTLPCEADVASFFAKSLTDTVTPSTPVDVSAASASF